MRGGKREGAGRKVGYRKADAAKKNNRIVILCTDEENELIKSRAQEEGLKVSAYILKKVLG